MSSERLEMSTTRRGILASIGLTSVSGCIKGPTAYRGKLSDSDVFESVEMMGECLDDNPHHIRFHLSDQATTDEKVASVTVLRNGDSVGEDDLNAGETQTSEMCVPTGEFRVVAATPDHDVVAEATLTISEISEAELMGKMTESGLWTRAVRFGEIAFLVMVACALMWGVLILTYSAGSTDLALAVSARPTGAIQSGLGV